MQAGPEQPGPGKAGLEKGTRPVRNDTPGAAESYRGGTIGGTMPPAGNTTRHKPGAENCSTPAPDLDPERRSDRTAFQTVVPVPANAGDSLNATVSETSDRRQRGAAAVSVEWSSSWWTGEPAQRCEQWFPCWHSSGACDVDANASEDALEAAWQLQRRAG